MTDLVAPEPETPLAQIAQIVSGRVTFTDSSLTILDPAFGYDDFERLLYFFGLGKRALSFWIGDLLNFGEEAIGDRYAQAMEVTGLRYETLTNYAYVCRRVARSRRRDQLPFGVHDAVASLAPAEQSKWLAEAEKHGWSRSQTRDAIRAAAGASVEPQGAQGALPDPLSARSTVDAARTLQTVRETLTATLLSGSDASLLVAPAIRELDKAAETLVAAASLSDLRDVVVRLLGQATSASTVDEYVVTGSYALVPESILDELREIVGTDQREE